MAMPPPPPDGEAPAKKKRKQAPRMIPTKTERETLNAYLEKGFRAPLTEENIATLQDDTALTRFSILQLRGWFNSRRRAGNKPAQPSNSGRAPGGAAAGTWTDQAGATQAVTDTADPIIFNNPGGAMRCGKIDGSHIDSLFTPTGGGSNWMPLELFTCCGGGGVGSPIGSRETWLGGCS